LIEARQLNLGGLEHALVRCVRRVEKNMNFGVTSDFSRVASRYDATREVPEMHLAACYERLVRQGLLPTKGVVLDAGCGTGQISLVLAKMGYEVHGIDVSAEMVAIAQGKCRPEWQAHYRVGDIRSLPEIDSSFNAVVVSKVFQHVHNWQAACQELLRVLMPGGSIFHLNEMNAFGNCVRKYFAGCADSLGFTERFVGLRERAQLSDFLVARGCEKISIDVTDLKWEKRITYGEALSQLQERLFAEFWYLPTDAYERILSDTALWVDEQPEGRNEVEVMTPYLSAEVFWKPRV